MLVDGDSNDSCCLHDFNSFNRDDEHNEEEVLLKVCLE